VTLTSPSKIVEVNYNPNVDGIGGACPTGCYFDEESVSPLASSNNLDLEVIKGLWSYTGVPSIEPMYFLTTPDQIAHYNLQLNQTFTEQTVSAANTWLVQPDVTTAGQIISSAYAKQ
jgi:hypothetical protein